LQEQKNVMVEYRTANAVAVITMNSPKTRNSMNPQLWSELGAAIVRANNDNEIGAIVVTGVDKIFNAGGDMKECFLPKLRGEVPYDDDDNFLGGIGLITEDWITFLRESKPVIAAVNGVAVGGGATTFLSADVIVASSKARFDFMFTKLGVVAEVCSTRYLPIRVGFGRASEILLSARSVDAQEAYKIGLVDYLFEHDCMLVEAIKIAERIAQNPKPITAMMKQLITDNAFETDISKVWKRESDALRQCFALPEHKKAVEGFLAKLKDKGKDKGK
jgi:enoyl-CoA hydratase/carnithine racemase